MATLSTHRGYPIPSGTITAKRLEDITAIKVALSAIDSDIAAIMSNYLNQALLGVANGVATLNSSAQIPAIQLPSFVDDVLEFASLAAFPAIGESAKIYLAINSQSDSKEYRWSGSRYWEISPSPGSSDAVPEGAANLYHTTARAAAAAPVQLVAGRAGNVVITTADIANCGTKTIPQNSKSAAYTAVLADNGAHLFHPAADTSARVWSIPANTSVPYDIGTALTFINQNGGGAITITCGDTMRLAGAGTTGSRTLAANGIATAIKITATEWLISGVNLT